MYGRGGRCLGSHWKSCTEGPERRRQRGYAEGEAVKAPTGEGCAQGRPLLPGVDRPRAAPGRGSCPRRSRARARGGRVRPERGSSPRDRSRESASSGRRRGVLGVPCQVRRAPQAPVKVRRHGFQPGPPLRTDGPHVPVPPPPVPQNQSTP